jgi:hypothetical protein
MAGDVHGASGGGWFPSGWGAVILSLSFHYRQGHGLPLLLAEEVAERLLDFFRCLVARDRQDGRDEDGAAAAQ